VLLKENITDWINCNEQKCIGSQFWKLKSSSQGTASGEGFLAANHMAEGIAYHKGKKDRER
jgi:hypothetical protein